MLEENPRPTWMSIILRRPLRFILAGMLLLAWLIASEGSCAAGGPSAQPGGPERGGRGGAGQEPTVLSAEEAAQSTRRTGDLLRRLKETKVTMHPPPPPTDEELDLQVPPHAPCAGMQSGNLIRCVSIATKSSERDVVVVELINALQGLLDRAIGHVPIEFGDMRDRVGEMVLPV